MRPTPIALALAFAACAAIVVATFLPWQETALNGEVSGFGSGGWATMVLGLIAGFNLATWRVSGKPRDAYVAAAVGLAAILASGYLIYDFSSREEGLFEESSVSDPLIGGYVALGAAVVLSLSALLLARTSPPRTPPPPPSPAPGDQAPPPPPAQ